MKKLLTILLFVPFFLNATDYYFSNEGNNGGAGTIGDPWQTNAKFNATTFSGGDRIYFSRGDVFTGPFVLLGSGSSGNPITIGAYGSGNKPEITGFVTVPAWSSLGSNIYESTSAVSTLSTCSMVVINGVNTAMGRFPNSGWITITGNSTTSVTGSSGQLPSSPSYSSGECVIRKNHYIIDRCPITSHSSQTINFSAPSNPLGLFNFSPANGYGFFIQANVNTLDVQNEWFYNTSTKKLRIYSTSSPTGVKVPTVDELIDVAQNNYVTFDNLKITGSNTKCFQTGSSLGLTIQNCDFDFHGLDLVWGRNNFGSPGSLFFNNNTVNHTGNTVIHLADEYTSGTINSNSFLNTGVIVGAGASFDESYQVTAIRPSTNFTIEYNTIDGVGYAALAVGELTTVRYNFINNFCTVKDDGGGIYLYNDGGSGNTQSGIVIQSNIILNGTGAGAGTADGQDGASGIYLDDYTNHAEVFDNTIANCALSGLFLHNTHHIHAYRNTIYNNETTSANQGGQWLLDGSNSSLTNLNIKRNIFFAKTSAERTANLANANTGWSFGTIDSNYYARPIGSTSSIHTFENSYSTENDYTLAQWKTASSQDANSSTAPFTISDVSELRFEYNATNSTVCVNLGAVYKDIYGTTYSGSISLNAWSSAVLVYFSSGGTACSGGSTPNSTILRINRRLKVQ